MVAAPEALRCRDVLPQALACFAAQRAPHNLATAACASHGDVELADQYAEDDHGNDHDAYADGERGPVGEAIVSILRDDGHDAGLRWQ
jgi:hypothetical protein